MWMRHVGGHERSRAGDGQLNTQANRYVLQLGGDLAQWSSNAQDRWHLGVMAGYANQHSNTQSNRVGYKSDGRISGYSAGLYATGIRTMRIRPALMLTAGRCITGLITASVPITVLLTTMILAV
ncbi:outer membrane autotransporter barrel domain protein [Escherichia coli]|uniref:Outer membrane autotransporter barrel domain protein n=1 Tax=Escherichia coli TaxID=562 RepID=A0A377BD25_ECOLX|nr:outer membrane autotransporter barrel domain protein [Escherichia coli]